MMLTMLKCKIHRATVTEANLEYEGSIGIDSALMEMAGLLPGEQVHVLNAANGERFVTYCIEEAAGSGRIIINGPAAHLAKVRDQVVILAYVGVEEEQAKAHEPVFLFVDHNNTPRKHPPGHHAAASS